MEQSEFKNWEWLDKSFKQKRVDINGTNFGDIRGFYKYSFFCNDDNKVFMKLTGSVNDEESYVININKTWHNNNEELKVKYQNKLAIKAVKAQDIYSMRGYCDKLSIEELEYWYPMINADDLTMEEIQQKEMDANFDWLEKRVVSNNFELFLLDGIQTGLEEEQNAESEMT